MSDEQSNESITITQWEDIENIDRQVLRGIYANGFEKPSPIQAKAIVPIMNKCDVIAQAQSGTGKTGAFSVGAISNVDTSKNITQVIILTPTRELTLQVYDVIAKLSEFITDIRVQTLYGGTSTSDDILKLKEEVPHIIVGCPGRTYDMMRRNNIQSKNITMLILDEADEMLSSGFKDQIYNIFSYLNKDVQLCLFSATMPKELSNLTEQFMRDPVKILVKSEMLTLEGIQQYYVALEDDHSKYLTLKDLYASISVSQCIVYCNSIKRVKELYDAMIEDDYPVTVIHSNMEREERLDAYNEFKQGKYRVLISSNVTARGIDIQQVSTVINFDVPRCIHTYLHRIGRSGRWGRKGVGINFVTQRDLRSIKNIEQHYQTEIVELPESFVKLV